jgi:hypothetical protein
MTQDKQLKAAARQLAAGQGLAYADALRRIRAGQVPAGTGPASTTTTVPRRSEADWFAHGMPAGDDHTWVRPTSQPCPDCTCCSAALCQQAEEQDQQCRCVGRSPRASVSARLFDRCPCTAYCPGCSCCDAGDCVSAVGVRDRVPGWGCAQQLGDLRPLGDRITATPAEQAQWDQLRTARQGCACDGLLGLPTPSLGWCLGCGAPSWPGSPWCCHDCTPDVQTDPASQDRALLVIGSHQVLDPLLSGRMSVRSLHVGPVPLSWDGPDRLDGGWAIRTVPAGTPQGVTPATVWAVPAAATAAAARDLRTLALARWITCRWAGDPTADDPDALTAACHALSARLH